MFRLFKTVEEVPSPVGVTSLESYLKALAVQCAGLTPRDGETLRDLEDRHYRLESLKAELKDRESKMAKERQLENKYRLAKERQRLQKEIANVVA